MGELYYYMWEFVTSITIIILVIAYILYDRMTIRYEKLEENEKNLHYMNTCFDGFDRPDIGCRKKRNEQAELWDQ